jgi:hypothetical protein
MTWYFFKKCRRLYTVITPPWWLMIIGIEPVAVYQEGIVQINERGETREIWEEIK